MRTSTGGKRVIVGYDLGEEYSQISYCVEGNDVETLSLIAGAQEYSIPTLLYKREGINQWFYGNEALRYAREEQGVVVKDILQLAVEGEEVLIEGNPYDPVALLTLFVKRSLGLLSRLPYDKIDALMITCEKLDHRMVEVLYQVVSGLNLKNTRVGFQNYKESFYHYMIYQPEELWSSQTLLCDYRSSRMKLYRMECNKRTTPIVVFIDNQEYGFTSYEPMPEMESLRKEKQSRLDGEFLELMRSVCENNLISSVYLIGENYSEEWMQESLRFLCRGRRVFQGNNLYSKGACFGMLERLIPGEVGQKHVFLGEDKLKANVGIPVLRRGEQSYYALLDAGVNWYEAEGSVECYLQGENVIEFTIIPLSGKESRTVRIALDQLTGELNRVQICAWLKEENRMVVEITDLGLGEMKPATECVWTEEIELY